MKRLYVSDLDGTLLNNEGVLSEFSFKTILALIEAGVNFTVASARSVQSIQHILQGLPLRLPIVSFNGAYVSDFKTGHHYEIQAIKNPGLFDFLNKHGVLVSTHKDNKDILYSSGPLSAGVKSYLRDREKIYDVTIKSIEQLPDHVDIMAYTLIDTYEKLSKVKILLESYEGIVVDLWEDMYYKPWWWMSIHAKSATKAIGIEGLIKAASETFDEIVVFGDNTNDIEMFRKSDISIAVENAVQELKAHADYVIGRNEADSVVSQIAKMEGVAIDTLRK